MSISETRDALHRLIDELRPEDVGTAQRILVALNTGDPLLLALSTAPPDDEEETESEREASERARRDIREGTTISHDEITRKLRRA